MNVLVISHFGLYNDLTASFVHNQVKALVSAGCRVRVLIPEVFGKTGFGGEKFLPFLKETFVDGAELYYFRHFSLSRLGRTGGNARLAIASLAPILSRVTKDFKPDIIHAHTLGYDSIIGAWLKKKFSCPLIVTTHGTDAARPLENGQGALLKAWCDAADVVVAVSSALRDKMLSASPEKTPRVILNGFEAHALPQDDIVRDPFRLIQVGHLIPSKRFDVTIRALALLKKDFPALSLSVIGEGAERAHLEALRDELGLHDSVHFLGKLPNAEVLREMCASSFYVMASKPEGFGIVYTEAMSSGCLTIGTEGEGIADLIRSGENGYLVPVDDPAAIRDVIAASLLAPEKAALIAARGKKDALHLTWEANAQQYLRLYRELLGS